MLTIEMEKAMTALNNYGKLKRYSGGFWSAENVDIDKNGVPVWYIRPGTIQALIRRNLLDVTYRSSKYGPYPVEVMVKKVA